jgi:hypothetical protein
MGLLLVSAAANGQYTDFSGSDEAGFIGKSSEVTRN